MSDGAVKKRANIFGFRIGRPLYWLLIGLLVVLSLGLGLVTKSDASSGLAVVWAMLYAWRLHDIGRSGWWSVGAIAAMLLIMAAGLLIGLKLYGADGPRFETAASVGTILAGVLQLGFTIWLGCVRGDPGPNRFGERTTLKVAGRTL